MDGDQSKICLELYKTQIDRFKDTRQIQWKINIAFWTFILVSSSYLYGKYQISSCEAFWIGIPIVVMHSFWVFAIQTSLETDIALFEKYRNNIHDILKLKNNSNKDNKYWKCWNYWKWRLLQIFVTIVFLGFSLYFLHKNIRG